MDDLFYLDVIVISAKRICELESFLCSESSYLPRRPILEVLEEYQDGHTEVLTLCNENVLVWNCLLYALERLSKPLIPFELIHGRAIDIELLSAILALLPTENFQPLESTLSAIGHILFGGNTGENREEGKEVDDSRVAELFPFLITSIGFTICRPIYSSFMSITHKQGYEEIGMLLTIMLDNKKWLFDSVPVFQLDEQEEEQIYLSSLESVEDEKLDRGEEDQGKNEKDGVDEDEVKSNNCIVERKKDIPQKDQSSHQIPSKLPSSSSPSIPSYRTISYIMRSGLLTTEPDIANSFSEAVRKHFQIAAYSEYGIFPLIPRPDGNMPVKPMIAEELFDLQTVAMGAGKMHTSSLVISVAGRRNDVVYNNRVDGALRLLCDRIENLAVLLLQNVIRRKNCCFVYTTQTTNAITQLPKRSSCCLWCRRPKRSALEFDFTSFFEESEWNESTSTLLMKPREERLLYLQRLQMQLLEVEKRLPSNEKVDFIESSPYLLDKYNYYQKVVYLLTNRR